MAEKKDFENGGILNVKLDQLNEKTNEVNTSIKEMHKDVITALNRNNTTNIQLLQKICFQQDTFNKEFEKKDNTFEAIKKKLNTNIYMLIPIIAGLITIIIFILNNSDKKP